MWFLPLLFLCDSVLADAPHLEQNPIYRELRQTGVDITAKNAFKLQAPYLADGLDAAEQRKLIEKLGGRRYPWERMTHKSTVAPQIIHLDEETPANTKTKARMMHVYFVVFGDMQAIAKKGGLMQPDNTTGKQWKELTAKDLAAKKITAVEPDHESYGYFTNDVIDKIRLSGVLRTYWTQTEDSLLAAAVLDSRFDGDETYPNRWQPLTRGRDGFEAGKPSPYHGAGGYTKITKLRAPAGALFVESHLIFAEPHAWFNGTNLLSSKLAAVIQHEVRSARREIMKLP